jgi:nucleoside-diphosphate-sugar epimerase
MSAYWDDTSVLVTGGMGFIGSSLARCLVDEGASVTILDARLPEYGANQFNIRDIEDAVDVVERDVRSRDEVEAPVREADVVYHCAAQLSRPESMSNPQKDTDINCNGLLNVLDTCAALKEHDARRFPSSQAVVGKPNTLPIAHDTPASPLDVYGANKRAGEMYCEVYERTQDVSTTAVRLTNVYGPRAQLSNSNYGVIQQFIRAAIEGEELTVFEPGTMRRDFVYIDDVVSGLLALGQNDDVVGERYLIGSGTATTIRQLAESITSVAKSGTVELVPWPEEWDSIRVGDIESEPSKLQSNTGWEPRTRLEEGLKMTIDYYRAHIDQYL